ncbi:MAG: glycerol-3-phosphate dehydrogenase subunit GlpB [Gaiellaceae bacterium]
MNSDVVVVGAGLAGLTAALRLAESGLRVVVVAKGVGATHLGGGTIDVLGYAPERVESPAGALPEFTAAHPEHPYAGLPPEALAASVDWLQQRVAPLRYVGGLAENFLLPTAVGAAKPSAVVPETMAAGDLRGGGAVAIVGLRGLRDFYAAYLADNLGQAASVSARALELELPPDGNAEPGGLGFARRFEQAEFRTALVRELGGRLEAEEWVGFPAVLGLTRAAGAWSELQERLGRPVFEIPTLPPSIPGMRLFQALTTAFRAAGGRLLIGPEISGGETSGGRVEAVVAQAAARTVTHRARWFVLASGGFAAGGLELDSYGEVREPVFGLPVAGVPERGRRFDPGYFEEQPLSRAGLAVDERQRPVGEEGRPVFDNLYAAGAMLAGAVPWREGSGNGISLATGYAAASAILERAS